MDLPFLVFGLPFSLEELIRAVGYPGIFAIVFAESGLLIGAFLPGDSLLFTAGFLASQGYFNIVLLCLLCTVAAIAGDAVGYSYGRRFGRQLFQRPDSRWFKQKHLLAAEAFYEKHGGKTIILARFMPVVRTFAPVIAGVSNMQYRRFAFFNVIGGVLWGTGITVAGYVLGSSIADPDRYLLPIVALIIVASALPSVIHIAHANRHAIRERLRRRGRAEVGES